MTKTTRYFMISAIVIILVIGFGIFWYSVAPHRYAEKYKKDPKHFVVLSGNIAEALLSKTHFDGEVVYQTHNPVCERFHHPRKAYAPVPVIRSNTGNYSTIAFLDYYERGYCQWAPTHVDIHVTIGTHRYAINEPASLKAPMGPHATLTINPVCTKTYQCTTQTFPHQTFNPNRSYYYEMNVAIKTHTTGQY